MKKRFSEEQIIGFLREAEACMAIKDLCRRHGFSEASFYLWRKKYGWPGLSEFKCLWLLGEENRKLKQRVADLSMDKAMLQEMVTEKL